MEDLDYIEKGTKERVVSEKLTTYQAWTPEEDQLVIAMVHIYIYTTSIYLYFKLNMIYYR